MTMISLFKKCRIWTKFQNGHDIRIKTIVNSLLNRSKISGQDIKMTMISLEIFISFDIEKITV